MLTRRLACTFRSATRGTIPHEPKRIPIVVRRSIAGDTGDNKSGHIKTAPSQGIIFFNSILPPNLQWLFRLTSTIGRGPPKLADLHRSGAYGITNPSEIFQKATRDAKLDKVDVVEVLPRFGEGGAFLKFSHDGAHDVQSVAEAVRTFLTNHKQRPWWNPFTVVRSSLVHGKPWVEDLARRPSRRLRVEFLPTEPGAEVAELSQEQLYSFFRPFGKLSEIVAQPSDSKAVPRFAYLDFCHYRKAIMAKNCMHGFAVSDADGGGKTGTVLRLTYEKKPRFAWVTDWAFAHPRIVIPILAALIAGISFIIFDPVRTFSIKTHITRAWHFEDNFVFRWFLQKSEDLMKRVRSLGRDEPLTDGGMQVVWDDRHNEIEQIQSWLLESSDTFIVVQGPRGSGKRELVIEHALKHKREAHRLLVVDCKPVQEARGDSATIAAAAAQVGYRPVFSWMNSISGLMDLAAQGLTGAKAGFSETLDTHLSKIWTKTSTALKSIALEGRRGTVDSKVSDDEFLEAHPEHRPVVVIDNFLHKSSEPGAALVYEKLAEWAAQLTTSNIAHVVFLTTDVSYGKALGKALPDRVFRQVSLGDCSPEIAKRYVINHLDFDAKPTAATTAADGEDVKQLTPSQKREDLGELDEVIDYLGGRLTDLEFFARRIKAGERPSRAVREIVDQSASEILKMYLLLTNNESEKRPWSTSQAWTLIRGLARNDCLRYHEVLLQDAFKTSNGDKALQALEQAELITVQSANGRPYSVRPGRPVYQPAFQQLVEDNVLRARMELALLADAIAGENKTIDKFEQELRLLAELPRQPNELYDRTKWLLGKIRASQQNIQDAERESAALKKILQTEF